MERAITFIEERCDIDARTAETLARLFSDDNEIAYIARYKRNETGGLEPNTIRHAFDAFQQAKEMEAKIEKAMKMLSARVTDQRELAEKKAELDECRTEHELNGVVEAYRVKRKAVPRADELRELAKEIVELKKCVNLNALIGSEFLKLRDVEEAISEVAADVLNRSEAVTEFLRKTATFETRVRLTLKGTLAKKAKELKEGDADFALIDHFRDYVAFEKPAKYVLNHQILALERGEEKGILKWTIAVEGLEGEQPFARDQVHPAHEKLWRELIIPRLNKTLMGRVQRLVRRTLSSRAEQSAIACFAANLRALFASAPVSSSLPPGRPFVVVAIDPGFSHGCKTAVLDSNGNVIATTVLRLMPQREKGDEPQFQRKPGCEELASALGKVERNVDVVVGIGNGTASTQTQFAVARLIREKFFIPRKAHFCVVTENGASKYSITKLAEEELPGMDINLRSAVSIGRRLISPMGEYVKIEPKHLGVGQYQHSCNEKRLSEALRLVIREAVSLCGADLNTASVQLLEQVCGLNAKTAKKIVERRQKEGPFVNREQLKNVVGIGPKTFELCAGFLTAGGISAEGEPKAKKSKKVMMRDPLDTTIVHPSQYDTARKLIKRAGLSLEDVGTEKFRAKIRRVEKKDEEEALIVDELLAEPFSGQKPLLLTEVRKVNSVEVGEVMRGRVENVVDFGLFIDLGLDTKALAHRSTFSEAKLLPHNTPLSEFAPQTGAEVVVRVLSVDVRRRRIGVSIINNPAEEEPKKNQSSIFCCFSG